MYPLCSGEGGDGGTVPNPDSKRESYEQRADHTSRHTKNEEWGDC